MGTGSLIIVGIMVLAFIACMVVLIAAWLFDNRQYKLLRRKQSERVDQTLKVIRLRNKLRIIEGKAVSSAVLKIINETGGGIYD